MPLRYTLKRTGWQRPSDAQCLIRSIAQAFASDPADRSVAHYDESGKAAAWVLYRNDVRIVEVIFRCP